MPYKSFLLSALLALAVAPFSSDKATADSVMGSVLDSGKDPPANGVSGAKVQLRLPNGKLVDRVFITDTDGQYHIVDVEKGDYTLVVTKVGYAPRPHELTKVKIDGNAKADDVVLMQDDGTDVYYSVVATHLLNKVAAAPKDARRTVFTYEWNNWSTINLPPSSKARLSIALNKQDAKAGETLPDLKIYLTAKPEQITKAQALFGQALAGNRDLPERESLGDLGLSDEIVADMVLFQVKNSTEPKKKTETFIHEFLLKWDETQASKRFLTQQKKSLEDSASIESPK